MNRSRAKVFCFDCGMPTGAPVKVYRRIRHEDSMTYKAVTFVHRAGTGCHKGETPAEVREIR